MSNYDSQTTYKINARIKAKLLNLLGLNYQLLRLN